MNHCAFFIAEKCKLYGGKYENPFGKNFSRNKNSRLRALQAPQKTVEVAEDLVQILPNDLKQPFVSTKRALKKWRLKTLKPLISQGFQVCVSILVTLLGGEGGIRTLETR